MKSCFELLTSPRNIWESWDFRRYRLADLEELKEEYKSFDPDLKSLCVVSKSKHHKSANSCIRNGSTDKRRAPCLRPNCHPSRPENCGQSTMPSPANHNHTGVSSAPLPQKTDFIWAFYTQRFMVHALRPTAQDLMENGQDKPCFQNQQASWSIFLSIETQ